MQLATTPPPSRASLDGARALLDRIEDDEARFAMGVALWHLSGAIERLEKRATATSNADARAEAAERNYERRAARLAAVDLDSFDPHGHFVYFLWGDDSECPLYVGMSGNILGRLGDHMRNPQRASAVRRVTVTRCATEGEMRALEKSLIRRFRPPWNVVGLTGPGQNGL